MSVQPFVFTWGNVLHLIGNVFIFKYASALINLLAATGSSSWPGPSPDCDAHPTPGFPDEASGSFPGGLRRFTEVDVCATGGFVQVVCDGRRLEAVRIERVRF